jgi:hypothetical protein
MTVTVAQLYEMVTVCTDTGTFFLSRRGEFFPYGAVIFSDGRIAPIMGYLGEDVTDSHQLYRYLHHALVTQASGGTILAAALAADVTVPSHLDAEAPDAIRMQIESETHCLLLYLPYTLQATKNPDRPFAVTILTPVPVATTPTIFSPDEQGNSVP